MLSLNPFATAVVTQRAEELNSFSNPSPQFSSVPLPFGVQMDGAAVDHEPQSPSASSGRPIATEPSSKAA